MSNHDGLAILRCLAQNRFVGALPSDLVYDGGGYTRTPRKGQHGGTPWCQDWGLWHHHVVWSVPFWSLLRKGYVEEFACYIRGDVLYRISDRGRAALERGKL